MQRLYLYQLTLGIGCHREVRCVAAPNMVAAKVAASVPKGTPCIVERLRPVDADAGSYWHTPENPWNTIDTLEA